MNFPSWECADDGCLGTLVSLLIGLLYASLQPLWIIAKIKTREMCVWAKFAKISSRENFYLYSSFLFTLQRQKKVCTLGDEAVMKIHKKLFSGIPFNFTLFVMSPKLQRIWRWNFGFAIKKTWAFIWYRKIYYFRLSPGGWECDRHKVL